METELSGLLFSEPRLVGYASLEYDPFHGGFKIISVELSGVAPGLLRFLRPRWLFPLLGKFGIFKTDMLLRNSRQARVRVLKKKNLVRVTVSPAKKSGSQARHQSHHTWRTVDTPTSAHARGRSESGPSQKEANERAPQSFCEPRSC